MIDEKKLLNCPFCGGEAAINVIAPHTHVFAKMPDYTGGAFIECSKCTCAMSGETEEEVINAWNTRKPMDEMIKHMKETSLYDVYMYEQRFSKDNFEPMRIIVDENDYLKKEINELRKQLGMKMKYKIRKKVD